MVKIVVSGALGRMGKRIVELAESDPELQVVGKLELEANPKLKIVSDLNDVKLEYDSIIEFTSPKATLLHVEIAKKLKKPIVIGTTGLTDGEVKIIKEASSVIPVVYSPNMSVGVNVLFNLIGKASKIFGKDYKVSIKEAHHIHKKDKPSGTAKLMGDIVCKETGISSVPTDSIREDEIVGDHEIAFESGVDTLKISHSAKTRDIFVLGALKAAKFVSKKKKGFFSMSDVLGMEER